VLNLSWPEYCRMIFGNVYFVEGSSERDHSYVIYGGVRPTESLVTIELYYMFLNYNINQN